MIMFSYLDLVVEFGNRTSSYFQLESSFLQSHHMMMSHTCSAGVLLQRGDPQRSAGGCGQEEEGSL